LKAVLDDRNLSTTVGDEGGFAPELDGTEDAIETIELAVKQAGYTFGEDILLALDCAAAEFYKDGKYNYQIFEVPTGEIRSSLEQIEYLASLCTNYPIITIEDGLDENDWSDRIQINDKIRAQVQLVGDALFVTNVDRLKQRIETNNANSMLF